MTKSVHTLDSVLVQLGDYGRYQNFVFGLISLAVIFNSIIHIAFVFSARNISYRCQIPECEISNSTIYNPKWLTNAVPYTNNKPVKCERFRPFVPYTNHCSSVDFDRTVVEKCDKYVFESPEITIVNDFGLYCEENVWKLTMIGTMNNVGQFVGLPIAGIVSDRLGRRTTLIWGMVLAGVAGIAKAFTQTYIWFVFFEFLDALLGAGTYACGFILGMELVGPSKRILCGTIISCCYAVGEVAVALLAWWLQSWRPLVLYVYILPLLLISYYWLTPESVRWLLAKGKVEEAKSILQKVAKVNKKTLTDETLASLVMAQEKEETIKDPFLQILKSSPLLLRFINCCFCWITCTFLFYGLTLNSVALAGNPYVDFILTSIVEIPAYFITYMTLDRWGRRSSQCVWFLMTGFCCLISTFASQDLHWLQLLIYLVGKFGATAAFTVMYVITSEIFPTPLRHSMMGACSMFGRIGSMVSPQMPLLSQVWNPLPLLLFGIMATIAGLLSLLFPETLNTKLPDTIEEAENIGKSREDITKM